MKSTSQAANIVYNLRYRWKDELIHLTDEELLQIYEDFYFSDLAGNNDQHFLQYLKERERA